MQLLLGCVNFEIQIIYNKKGSRKVPEGPACGVDARVSLPVDVASARKNMHHGK